MTKYLTNKNQNEIRLTIVSQTGIHDPVRGCETFVRGLMVLI
jgi:hypothetical protein